MLGLEDAGVTLGIADDFEGVILGTVRPGVTIGVAVIVVVGVEERVRLWLVHGSVFVAVLVNVVTDSLDSLNIEFSCINLTDVSQKRNPRTPIVHQNECAGLGVVDFSYEQS